MISREGFGRLGEITYGLFWIMAAALVTLEKFFLIS